MKLKYLVMGLIVMTAIACKSNPESGEGNHGNEHKAATVSNDKETGHKEGDEKISHDTEGKAKHEEGRESAGHDGKEGGEHANRERGEHGGESGEHGARERGEHTRDTGERNEGEEDATLLKLTDKYDKVRNGVRLILAYDEGSNSFKGTVENTLRTTVENVRIEVHLSNGKELGPTKSINLGPGTKRGVELKATSTDFESWSTHAEVGNSEHGHTGNEKGEHN